MPTCYLFDLCWQIVWFHLVHGLLHKKLLTYCVYQNVPFTLFHQTGDLKPVSCRSRPQKLVEDLWAAKVSKYIMTHQCLFGLTKVVVTVETASENMAIASMASVLCEVLNTLLYQQRECREYIMYS